MVRFKINPFPAGPIRFKVSAYPGEPIRMDVEKAVVVLADTNHYDGPYEVTPKADEAQTLPTKNTILSEDVTVLAVPFYEADNQNGTTIFIASEV